MFQVKASEITFYNGLNFTLNKTKTRKDTEEVCLDVCEWQSACHSDTSLRKRFEETLIREDYDLK